MPTWHQRPPAKTDLLLVPLERHALCTRRCGRIWNYLDRLRHVVFASNQCTTSKLKVNFNKRNSWTCRKSIFSNGLNVLILLPARFAFDECLGFSKVVFNFGLIFQMLYQPLPRQVAQMLVLSCVFAHTHTQTCIINMTHVLYSSQ